MTSQTKTLFATTATGDYVPHAKQLFSSAYEAGYWQGQFLLLAYGISAEDKAWFLSRGILVKEYDYIMEAEEWKTYPCSNAHRIMLERYHLFREEFKAWDVIVYMDSDIIVTGPLVRLAATQGFAATLDRRRFLKTNAMRGSGYKALSEGGYRLKAPMFCAGMFAFNSRLIAADTYDNLITLTRRWLPVTLYIDQLILNLVYYRKWQRLSMSYAFALTLVPSVPLCRAYRAIALHFAARNRPWNPKSPYHALWQSNLAKAEKVDFTSPRHADEKVWAIARNKEQWFVPWFVYISSTLIDLLETSRWYPRIKKIFESPEL